MKHVFVFLFLLMHFQLKGQEIGYIGGVSKLGIRASAFQPLYGFSIGYQFNRYTAIETSMFYSQRSIDQIIQSDYLSFMAMQKIGYFSPKTAVYLAPALLLNPTLYHSNIENHTYISTLLSVGFQYRFKSIWIADIKCGYDWGISGAYFYNNSYATYKGPLLLLGMKCSFADKSKN